MRKYMVVIFLFAAFPFLLFAAGQQDPNAPFCDCELLAVQRVLAREVLRVGVLAENQPFSYQDSRGNWQGDDITIAQRLTKEILGTKASYLRIVPVSASNWVEQLNGDRVDIILGISPDFTGAEGADFAILYPVSERAAPAVRKGNDELVMWLNDVIGRRIETNFWK